MATTFKYRLGPTSWDGWYEGRKRPHRHTAFVITHVPAHGETRIELVDSSKRYDPPGLCHITALYRGHDFPRRRILKPDNTPVAASGVAQPDDFVVGNKFVIAAGKPPVVLRHCQDTEYVELGHQQGNGYHYPQPAIPYDDEGVPEWPPGYDPKIAMEEYVRWMRMPTWERELEAAARAIDCASEADSVGAGKVRGADVGVAGEEGDPAACEVGCGSKDGPAPASAGAGSGEPGASS